MNVQHFSLCTIIYALYNVYIFQSTLLVNVHTAHWFCILMMPSAQP